MILEINHLSFTVSDLPRSVRFYEEVLGLQCVSLAEREREFCERVTGIAGAEMRIAYMQAPNCAIELIQYLSPAGSKIDTRTCNVGSAHACFVVDDFEAFLARLSNAGVGLNGEVAIVPAGPNKGRGVAYFRDPDANNLEVFSSKPLTARA
jgi:catechol 2,3-dioxygenase-like lactoylglutathione lyase family enzyme